MDASVRADHLQKPVGIGALELGKRPVVQNLPDDGMLVLKLLQHIDIGAPAGLGLLSGGKHQLFKKHLSQLLGREDVELMPGQVPDLPLQAFDPFGETLPEGGQRLPVDQEAGFLHLGEHPAKGQLNLLEKPGLAVGLQLFPQDRGQHGNRRGAVQAPPQIALGQIGQLIAAVRSPQQVGRQRRVEHEAVPRKALAVQPVHQVLDIVCSLFYISGEERPAKRVIPFADLHLAQMPDPIGFFGKAELQFLRAAVRPEGDKGGVLDPLRQDRKFIRGDGNRLRLLFLCHVGGCSLTGPRVQVLQTPLVNHSPKAQALHEGQELRCPPQRPAEAFRLFAVQRHLAEDRRQPVGAVGAVLSGGKLFAHAVFNLQRVQIPIDFPDAAVALYQIHGGLLADPRHPRNVVRAVAHQRLEVDHEGRLEAVLLTKALRCIEDGFGLPHPAFHVADRGTVRDKLKAVLVPGDDDTVVSLLLGDAGERAQNVIRLIARQLQMGHAHHVQQVLQHRHLYRQFLGHGLALGLIEVIAPMPESRFPPVKGDADCLRLLILIEMLKNRKKAVNGVGRRAVRGVQLANAEEGTVHDAVSVDEHEFHGGSPLS